MVLVDNRHSKNGKSAVVIISSPGQSLFLAFGTTPPESTGGHPLNKAGREMSLGIIDFELQRDVS